MKIYLAGPMRGKPQFNFPTFNKVAKLLRKKDHVVFNPAEADLDSYGTDFATSPTGNEHTAAKKIGKTFMQLRREVFLKDTAWICLHADSIALLPGWKKSKGAKAELALARALGLKEIYLDKNGKIKKKK